MKRLLGVVSGDVWLAPRGVFGGAAGCRSGVATRAGGAGANIGGGGGAAMGTWGTGGVALRTSSMYGGGG